MTETHEHYHDEHCHDEHEHHHHEQERVIVDEGDVFFSLLKHEGSLVASYRINLSCSLAEARGKLMAFTTGIADAVADAGGLVGHIKAYARERGDAFRISVTLHDPDILDLDEHDVQVEGVAIVFSVDESWYGDLVEGELLGLHEKMRR